jgi:DNA-binding HxlR family transcriptional regulator
MDWLEMSTANCSIQRTLGLIGDKWTLLIVRDAANGVRRFDDFHRHVGLSEPVLATRLRKLVDAGILEMTPYRMPAQRTRAEYRMTAKGWDLYPVLVALMQWGDQYLADPDGPPIRILHAGCGATVRAVVECSAERTPVTARDARVIPGPAAQPASAPRPATRTA